MSLHDLISPDTRLKVSSTLDKSVGKKYLTDSSPETCWTSQQGLPQYIQLGFPSPVHPKRIRLTFQGGFVGTNCCVQAVLHDLDPPSDAWQAIARFYPEDVNREQIFTLDDADDAISKGVLQLKLVFEESSDFFGRITIYDLRIEGNTIN